MPDAVVKFGSSGAVSPGRMTKGLRLCKEIIVSESITCDVGVTLLATLVLLLVAGAIDQVVDAAETVTDQLGNRAERECTALWRSRLRQSGYAGIFS